MVKPTEICMSLERLTRELLDPRVLVKKIGEQRCRPVQLSESWNRLGRALESRDWRSLGRVKVRRRGRVLRGFALALGGLTVLANGTGALAARVAHKAALHGA